jgi:hypothetical protein
MIKSLALAAAHSSRLLLVSPSTAGLVVALRGVTVGEGCCADEGDKDSLTLGRALGAVVRAVPPGGGEAPAVRGVVLEPAVKLGGRGTAVAGITLTWAIGVGSANEACASTAGASALPV